MCVCFFFTTLALSYCGCVRRTRHLNDYAWHHDGVAKMLVGWMFCPCWRVVTRVWSTPGWTWKCSGPEPGSSPCLLTFPTNCIAVRNFKLGFAISYFWNLAVKSSNWEASFCSVHPITMLSLYSIGSQPVKMRSGCMRATLCDKAVSPPLSAVADPTAACHNRYYT